MKTSSTNQKSNELARDCRKNELKRNTNRANKASNFVYLTEIHEIYDYAQFLESGLNINISSVKFSGLWV